MNFKKNHAFSAVLALFLTGGFCFSYSGALSGAKGKLSVIETVHFDIIYPAASAESAQKIARVADSYFDEICGKLDFKCKKRFPVTITNQVEQSNAYFSLVPYSHIVIYDTNLDSSLDYYEDTLESTFYHELTHAISMNKKDPFFQGMDFFSEALNPSVISLTSFWFEGATVSFESAKEGGRLNIPFWTQKAFEVKLQSLAGEKKVSVVARRHRREGFISIRKRCLHFRRTFRRLSSKKIRNGKIRRILEKRRSADRFGFCRGRL